jgi:mutual gliding-motility protein MglA
MPSLRFVAVAVLALAPAIARASFINYSSREINCKIVYYGSATSGLAENLQYVYAKTNPEAKGKMISLATETERVLFFDFLPLSLGEIRGFKTRFHLYTVPGEIFYEASRKLVLKGVDGVVFVADADPARKEATLESWKSLKNNLAEAGYDWKRMPLVLQLDTHRTKAPMSSQELLALLGAPDLPVFVADPVTGPGVFDTLKAVAKAILMELKKGTSDTPTAQPPQSATVPASPAPPARPPPPPPKPCGVFPVAPNGKECVVSREAALAAIRASPLKKFSAWIEQRLEPAIWLTSSSTSMDKLAPGASRFGGVPYVPAGFAWPTFKGKPLAFLAQLSLKDAAPLDAGRQLPRTGWFTVFADEEGDEWSGTDTREAYRVIFFDAKPEALKRATAPASKSKSVERQIPRGVSFKPAFTLRELEEERGKAPFASNAADRETYQALVDDVQGQLSPSAARHHLLGHPQLIQGEMRSECQELFGASPGRKQTPEEIEKGAQDWVLLLQIDSDDGAGWMWGDVGTLYFWIRKADLKAGAFAKTCTVLQCS